MSAPSATDVFMTIQSTKTIGCGQVLAALLSVTMLAGCQENGASLSEHDLRLSRISEPPEIAADVCIGSGSCPTHREKIRFSRSNPQIAEARLRDAYERSGEETFGGDGLLTTTPLVGPPRATMLVATEADEPKSEKAGSPAEPAPAAEVAPEAIAESAERPLGKFDEMIDVSEIDASEDEIVEPSASDWRTAELVPTPVATPEIVAEVVPTPLGLPENVRVLRKPPATPRSRADVIAVSPAGPTPTFSGPVAGSPEGGSPDESLGKPVRIAASPKESAQADGGPASPASKAPLSDTVADAPDDPTEMLDRTAAAASSAANAETPMAGPVDYKKWPTPDVTLFITGQQHGYIEPCGCTGLENQKGGVARRMSFATDLRKEGWELMPIDAGNLIRRFGRQAEIKFHRSLEALRTMGYAAVGFGPDDVRLGVGDLIQEAAAEKPEDAIYASANVVLLDPSLMPTYRIAEKAGMKIAVTSILDPAALESRLNEDITLGQPIESAKEVMEQIRAESPDYTVLTYYGKDAAAAKLAQEVPGFDLIVVAGGYGEPTYQPEAIAGSDAKMILTGNKGMYVGLVGLYKDADMRYARVPLDDSFADAPEMRRLMADYQFELRDLGLENLGLKPIPHPSGEKFVGSQACGKCHTTAYDIWENSPHFHATESLVHPGERGDVPRHFDPECISCHVTGWNPQNYYPYVSGYLDLQQHEHLHGNGCENCHGPGESHVNAESGTIKVTEEQRAQLRDAMKLPLEKAREKCMECHDLDNSPDFHEEGAFDDYWLEVEHYGLD